MNLKKTWTAAVVVTLLAGSSLAAVRADSILNKVLVGGAGVLAVKAIAQPLNGFINNLMLSNGVANHDKTKVVPIITVGSSTYIGAAQVTGPAYAIAQTQAVGEFAGGWNNNVWQVRAIVPINNLNVVAGGFKRVYGVGVDAVINAKL